MLGCDLTMNAVRDFIAENDVIIMGVTGVGKTTFVEQLMEVAPVRYVSLGEITRSVAVTLEGEHIRELMHRGGMWPLAVIQGLVEPHLAIDTPFVLDGVPKHIEEAEWLTERLTARDHPLAAITLHASRDTVHRRLSNESRLVRPETPEQIADRIAMYDEKYKTLMTIMSGVIDRIIEIDTTALTPAETVDDLGRLIA